MKCIGGPLDGKEVEWKDASVAAIVTASHSPVQLLAQYDRKDDNYHYVRTHRGDELEEVTKSD